MEELDLKELLSMFWEKKVAIIVVTLIFMIIGILYTVLFTTPMYSSSTTLVLVSSGGNAVNNQAGSAITTTDITMNSKLVSTYSVLIKSDNVVRQVISNLKLNLNEGYVKKNIKVTSEEDTEVIKITVTNEDPKTAAKIANEIVPVFTTLVKDTYKIENVQVIDKAEVDNTPSNINHTKDVVIFMFIGIVISVAYVLIINMLDTTIKSADDIEKEFKVHVLAEIPLYETEENGRRGGKRK